MCNCNNENELIPELGNLLSLEDELSSSLANDKSPQHKNLSYTQPKNSAGLKDISGIKIHRNRRLGYTLSAPINYQNRNDQEIDQEVVGTGNELRPVLDTTTVPYRWICRLELDFGQDPTMPPGNNIFARGTGILISPRHVLTCGHNLFNYFSDLQKGLVRQVQRIKVSPGYNCSGTIADPFGYSNMASVKYPDSWKTLPELDATGNINIVKEGFDYGLITLRSPIGNKRFSILGDKPLGYWGDPLNGENTRINPQTVANLQGRTVFVSGYPHKCCLKDMDPSKPCRDEAWDGAQFYSYGKITNASPPLAPRLIFHSADTFKGSSGSPLWIRWEQYRNLIAIHTGPGWTVDPAMRHVANRGIRITDEVMKQVYAWM